MFNDKKKLGTILIFLISLVSSTGILAQTRLQIAFQIPLEHHLAQNTLFFKQELEKISNGMISVKINDYGSYLKDIKDQEELNAQRKYFLDREILEAIKSRKVEVGMISLSRFAQLIPLVDIFHQPFLLDTEKKVTNAVMKDSVIRHSIEKSLEVLGITSLWWQPYGSVIYVSNGTAVQNPEQIKDKKVRVFGKTLGNLVLASGGIPLAIPNSHQYFAYKHKKVDIGMTTISEVRTKKIWEVMDTVSLANSASIQFLMIANQSWWNSLNQKTKRLISRAALAAENDSLAKLKRIEEDSYKEAIKNGMSIVVLSNDDREYWREKSSPIYKKFLENTGAEGQLAFDTASDY